MPSEFSNFVPGLTEAVDNLTAGQTALTADKNDTIEYQDHGVPVAIKGDVWYVNFGDGILVTVTDPNTITVEGTGGGGGLSQQQVEGLI